MKGVLEASVPYWMRGRWQGDTIGTMMEMAMTNYEEMDVKQNINYDMKIVNDTFLLINVSKYILVHQ